MLNTINKGKNGKRNEKLQGKKRKRKEKLQGKKQERKSEMGQVHPQKRNEGEAYDGAEAEREVPGHGDKTENSAQISKELVMNLPKIKWYHLVVLVLLVVLLFTLAAWAVPFVFAYYVIDRILMMFQRDRSARQKGGKVRKVTIGDTYQWIKEARNGQKDAQRN